MKKKERKLTKPEGNNWLSRLFKGLLSIGFIGLIWSVWFQSASLTISTDFSPNFQSDGKKLFLYLKNNSNYYAAKIIKGSIAVVSYGDSLNSEKKLYLLDEISYSKEIYRDETEPIVINLKNKIPIEQFKGHVHLLFVIYYRPFPFLPILKKELTGIFYYNPQGAWVKQSYSIKPQFFDEVFKALRSGKKPFN